MPNPDKMTECSEDSATLYLAVTIFYWMEKAVAKTSNMKHMGRKFRVHLSGLHQLHQWKDLQGRHGGPET